MPGLAAGGRQGSQAGSRAAVLARAQGAALLHQVARELAEPEVPAPRHGPALLERPALAFELASAAAWSWSHHTRQGEFLAGPPYQFDQHR